jgi:ribosomal protein S18 acetylase RimI-like enzyme
MSDHPLDNPIWHALRSRHRALAIAEGDVLRYPPEVAPFVAVERGGPVDDAVLSALVPPGEPVYMLGPVPELSAAWSLRGPVPLAQMVCPEPVAVVDGPEIVPLGEAQRADVLELAALVYPLYFRPRTIELGRYFGIYEGGRLTAMIGERMGMDGWREISAVCTHPDAVGRGLARRLLAWLGNDNLERGRTPFLHVSHQNERAIALYERNGYRTRIDIDYWSLLRTANAVAEGG